MSNLPEINYQKVAQRMGAELGALTFTKTTLEILAENLRDERDAALLRCAELESQLTAAKAGESNAV
jgi:hypothetical protein